VELSEVSSVRSWWRTGTAGVLGIAVATVAVHLATGWRYGFNRDELMALDDARHLAWGYVQYPPMTAFFGRVALILFGTSLVGFRFFAALVHALALVLTGLMAKELGGGKWAQVTAALAGVPFCLGGGALMQYISFDYVCWVWVAYSTVRVINGESGNGIEKLENGEIENVERSEGERVQEAGRNRAACGSKDSRARGERWWLGVGAGIGLGMLAKYTMGFLVVGVVAGVLLTEARRHCKSMWLWLGVVVACGIVLPNFIWEWQRNFISLDFLKFLHVRDVGEGLTDWFLLGQLQLTLLAFPLAMAGIWFYFLTEGGKRWRVLGWMYLVPLVLFLVMRGRDYYLAPGYPMLYAAGAVWVEWEIRSKEARRPRSSEERRDHGRVASSERFAEDGGSRLENRFGSIVRRVIWVGLILDVLVAGAVALPIAPVGSGWWKLASRVDSVLPEEIGWPEFVETVAAVRDRLPESERAGVGILAGNYGEVGALNLYGEQFGLPRAMSGVNSSWERGYGDPPETVIVAGYSREFLEGEFASCVVGGRVWNRFGLMNEETIEDPEIFVCRGLKGTWEEFWVRARRFA